MASPIAKNRCCRSSGRRNSVGTTSVAVTAAGALGAKHLAGLQCLFGACCADYRRRVRQPVPGSFTSIYSRQDKVVPWRASIDPAARNVEVIGSHLQLISSPEARRAVARVLRLPACDRRAAA